MFFVDTRVFTFKLFSKICRSTVYLYRLLASEYKHDHCMCKINNIPKMHLLGTVQLINKWPPVVPLDGHE
jgi:hypothetical protein